jgi:hypothetical protein
MHVLHFGWIMHACILIACVVHIAATALTGADGDLRDPLTWLCHMTGRGGEASTSAAQASAAGPCVGLQDSAAWSSGCHDAPAEPPAAKPLKQSSALTKPKGSEAVRYDSPRPPTCCQSFARCETTYESKLTSNGDTLQVFCMQRVASAGFHRVPQPT